MRGLLWQADEGVREDQEDMSGNKRELSDLKATKVDGKEEKLKVEVPFPNYLRDLLPLEGGERPTAALSIWQDGVRTNLELAREDGDIGRLWLDLQGLAGKPISLLFDRPSSISLAKPTLEVGSIFRGHEVLTRVTVPPVMPPVPKLHEMKVTVRGTASFVFVVDCSHSMGDPVASATEKSYRPFDRAMDALLTMLSHLDGQPNAENIKVFICVFGHRRAVRSDGKKVVWRIFDGNKGSFDRENGVECFEYAPEVHDQFLKDLKPWGTSPLYTAIHKAQTKLEKRNDAVRRIIVISDGRSYDFPAKWEEDEDASQHEVAKGLNVKKNSVKGNGEHFSVETYWVDPGSAYTRTGSEPLAKWTRGRVIKVSPAIDGDPTSVLQLPTFQVAPSEERPDKTDSNWLPLGTWALVPVADSNTVKVYTQSPEHSSEPMDPEGGGLKVFELGKDGLRETE